MDNLRLGFTATLRMYKQGASRTLRANLGSILALKGLWGQVDTRLGLGLEDGPVQTFK